MALKYKQGREAKTDRRKINHGTQIEIAMLANDSSKQRKDMLAGATNDQHTPLSLDVEADLLSLGEGKIQSLLLGLIRKWQRNG
jgi:hypothetical protein